MTWFAEGNRSGVRVRIGKSGSLQLTGECKQNLLWPSDDTVYSSTPTEELRRIEEAECLWSINPPSKEWKDNILNTMTETLEKQSAEIVNKPWGYIKFYGQDKPNLGDSISFNVVVPDSFFPRYHRLVESVMSSPDITYQFCFDFTGFRLSHAKSNSPSPKEFLLGRCIIFDSFSFSIKVD